MKNLSASLPTETEDDNDPDESGSLILTKRLAGLMVRNTVCCSGDEHHAAHIAIVFTCGTELQIIGSEDSFIVGIVHEVNPPAAGVH